MAMTYTGYIPVTAGTGSYSTIWGNAIYRPFSTANPISTTGLVTGTGGATIASAVAGYSSMAGLYGAYKVRRSRIIARFCPSASVDQTTVVVFPCTSNDGNPALQPFNATAQPYARSKMVVFGANVSSQTVTQTMDSFRVLGLTQAQYDALPYSDTATAPNTDSTAWTWALSWQLLGPSTNASPIAVSVTVEYEVDWAYPRTLTN